MFLVVPLSTEGRQPVKTLFPASVAPLAVHPRTFWKALIKMVHTTIIFHIRCIHILLAGSNKNNMCVCGWRKRHFKLEFNRIHCGAMSAMWPDHQFTSMQEGHTRHTKKNFIKQNVIKILIMRGASDTPCSTAQQKYI